MNIRSILATAFAVVASLATVVHGADWVRFVDETATRLVATPDVGASDTEEKSYAWGDVDRDGDDDLVVGRKEPFSTPGKRRNVLLLNEQGVLVDRTLDFAASSDVPGDSGFLTPTNDRDVLLVDVDLDGWLDVVTATAQGGSDPKHVAYPRVYRNLGQDQAGWLGFVHEDARIPTMSSYTGEPGFNPNFAAVAAGDVDGDGYPDLYFSDYDVEDEEARADFNDKLLVNQGAAKPGFFTDVTSDAFSAEGVVEGLPFPVSGYATSAAIADIDGDGAKDVLKQTGLNGPFYVGVAYNDPANQGSLDSNDLVYQASPYYVSAGDLNNDDRLDVVVTDDGADRYLLNQGNGSDGSASFSTSSFSFFHAGTGSPPHDQGFGGDNRIADLDSDGWPDVLVTDVTVDIPGCGRRMNVYRNLGGAPGSAVVLQEQTSGTGCLPAFGNPPSCIVAGLPSSDLEGVHDVAVFDIDGDGRRDLVLGRCTGTVIYMNIDDVPPVAAGGVPDGHTILGTPLTMDKTAGGVRLSWDSSCALSVTDYEVYEGTIGDFTSHVARRCSTGGATTVTLAAGDASYFLVVPRNSNREGSYGRSSEGIERPQATDPCLPQQLGGCD